MKRARSSRGVWTLAALFFVSACAGQAAKPNAGDATPRTADGKPDVTGVWIPEQEQEQVGGLQQVPEVKTNAVESTFISRTGGLYASEIDGYISGKGNRNPPMYRPEYWEKVRYLQANVLTEDPSFRCLPDGVPRMGPPQEILQQGNRVAFLYSIYQRARVPNPYYRVIRLDRRHDPERTLQQTTRGDSVGHWEGDTLVVDTIGFGDETWLDGRHGYFHSTDLHVVERFTRTGKTLKYEVIIEDPTVLLQPWVWAPDTLVRDPNPEAMLQEDFPCSERDNVNVHLRY
jgi:hypothetical protein